jgi:geranylgeranyl pyrophosphate synthase
MDKIEKAAALSAFMRDARQRVDDGLRGTLLSLPAWSHAPSVPAAMNHAVFAGGGGKRMRPALALLSAHLHGVAATRVLDAAIGLELIHSYTIIIDDIQDGDEVRRGEPATHVAFGLNDALLAAGRLFADGLTRVQDVSSVRPGVLRELMHFLHAGQEADLASDTWQEERKTDGALDFILRGKTGALFELAMLIGAGDNTSPQTAAQLRQIGSDIGELFQATDDLLEVTSNATQLGKPAGKDRGGKLTFVSRFPDVDACRAQIVANKADILRRVASIGKEDGSLLEAFIELTVLREK